MEQVYLDYLKKTKYSLKQFSIEKYDNEEDVKKYLNIIEKLIKKERNIIFYSIDKFTSIYHINFDVFSFGDLKFYIPKCNKKLITFLVYDDSMDDVKSLVCDLEIKDNFNDFKSFLNTEKNFDKYCSICLEYKDNDKMIRCFTCTNSTCKNCIDEYRKKCIDEYHKKNNYFWKCTSCRDEYYVKYK